MSKPSLTIDLADPLEGNAITMLGTVSEALEAAGQKRQAEEFVRRFAEMVGPSAAKKPTSRDIKNLIAEYCNVTWLNERR